MGYRATPAAVRVALEAIRFQIIRLSLAISLETDRDILQTRLHTALNCLPSQMIPRVIWEQTSEATTGLHEQILMARKLG